MINEFSIDGYRGFEALAIKGLSRVNLFVGANNSGKTSVLEALYLLASNGDPQSLWRVTTGRGETQLQNTFPQRTTIQPEIEVNHLFYGHALGRDTAFRLEAMNGDSPTTIEFYIVDAQPSDNPQLFATIANDVGVSIGPSMALRVSTLHPSISNIPLTSRGTIRQDTFQLLMNMSINIPRSNPSAFINSLYVSNSSLAAPELNSMWGNIALTEDEDRVIQALKFLDPLIERIAPSSPGPVFFQSSQQRGGFQVKMANLERPIPIGTLGDGTWRMLALAISLTQARNGILLIDEIDTGLHYSVMGNMWQIISKAAEAFNIQVFATTHSSDCIKSLASIESENASIQRLERGNKKTIHYSKKEIITAAEYNLEVR